MNFVKFLNDILRVFLNVYYVKYLLLYGSNGSSTVLLLSQVMTQMTPRSYTLQSTTLGTHNGCITLTVIRD